MEGGVRRGGRMYPLDGRPAKDDCITSSKASARETRLIIFLAFKHMKSDLNIKNDDHSSSRRLVSRWKASCRQAERKI